MASSEYGIPENLYARAGHDLHAQYRAQLDQQAAQRRGQIIDVRANRVSLENEQARAERVEEEAAAQRGANQTRESEAQRSRRAHRQREDEMKANADFYQQETDNGIVLRSGPQARGLFIDLMA